MSIFVEVLKRSYLLNKITIAKLDTLLQDGRITRIEYDFIIAV